MELKSIFVDEDSGEGLYSMQYDGENLDEFERLLDLWNDTQYLSTYLLNNSKFLNTPYFRISHNDAMTKILEEAEELENIIYGYCEKGFGEGENLQMIFKQLENKDTKMPVYQFSKAKIDSRKFPRFLRFYAIRISENTYIITGGAIKLSLYMSEHEDTKRELEKLELSKKFLIDNEISNLDDINYYYEQS